MIKTYRVLIADDHQLVRNGVRLMLENQKEFKPIISEVSNGEDALKIVQRGEVDVVLLDISMPGMDGLMTLKKIKTTSKNLPVLMLTMHNEENVIKQALKIGASGYILKNSGIDELVKAVLTIVDGENYYSNEVSQILLKGTIKKVKKPVDEKNELLSHREKQILGLIVRELTSKEIADELCLSFRTVEGHRNNIMEKLNIKTTIGLVKYAMQHNIE